VNFFLNNVQEPKMVPSARFEPSGRKASTLPMRYHVRRKRIFQRETTTCMLSICLTLQTKKYTLHFVVILLNIGVSFTRGDFTHK